MFLYTDGLIENKSIDAEPYGKLRLRKFIQKHNQNSPKIFVDLLTKEILEFYGKAKSLEDDVTFVAAKIKPFKASLTGVS